MSDVARVNLMLTLPAVDGFHDRLYVYETARGMVAYAVHTALGGCPPTRQTLEEAYRLGAGSIDSIEVSARREMRLAKAWTGGIVMPLTPQELMAIFESTNY